MTSITFSNSKILIIENSAPVQYKKWNNEYLSDRSVEATAQSVENALLYLGYKVKRLKIQQNPQELLITLQDFRPNLVFQLCESINGISKLEPTIPYLLSWLNIPFTGNLPSTLALLLDKAKTKHILFSLNLPTPKFIELYDQNQNNLELWSQYPSIIKPNNEDASLGIDNNSIVYNKLQVIKRFNQLKHLFDIPLLLEEFVEGREINIALLERSRTNVLISFTEIDFSKLPSNAKKILTYNSKWVTTSEEYKQTPSIGANSYLEKNLKEKLSNIAYQAWKYFDLRGYARIDIRIDKNNNPYILEINPNPDLAPDAGFAKSMYQLGLAYEDIISIIVNSALNL